MRVLVCGGRNYADKERVRSDLDALARRYGLLTIIEGGALGADRLARRWAEENLHGLVTFDADWNRYGPAAGPVRNAAMIEHGRPDLVLAFPGGRGTADMIAKARAAGIEIREILA